MSKGQPNRRKVLGLLAGLGFAPARAHAIAPSIATIDWGLLETTLALGITPAAATELLQFRKIAIEPKVPNSVADLGLRGTPSYELLRIVRPDLILISGFYEYQRASLERIAPVLALPVYEAGKPPYALAEYSTRALGERLGRDVQARALVDETRTELALLRQRLAPVAARPIFVISLGDSRHFRAFGADSMFGDVLGRLGLVNAWTDPTSYSAAAPVGLEALAGVPDASIAVVAPLPPDVGRELPENALWNALPAVREGRIAVLDPINHFGALPAARRFARLFAAHFAPGARP